MKKVQFWGFPDSGQNLGHQPSPDIPTNMSVPYGMHLQSQIAVVVGYVHCHLTAQQISLALGYRSNSNDLAYTWNQVTEVFNHLRNIANIQSDYNVYYLWGPRYQAINYSGEYRISEAKMLFHKRLVMEALRRGMVVQDNWRRQNAEIETRKQIWIEINRLGPGQWGAFDDRNLLWDGIDERRAVIDGTV